MPRTKSLLESKAQSIDKVAADIRRTTKWVFGEETMQKSLAMVTLQQFQKVHTIGNLTMADLQQRPSFEAVPMSSGNGWRVRMIRPSGQLQYITGFDTKAAAIDWIEREGPGWFNKTEGD